MAKKSNKTSHVLNLITNRTGISTDDLEQPLIPPEQINTEAPAERAVEAPVEKIVEIPIERASETSVKRRINVADISGDITMAVSEQIRASLELVEIEEAKTREQVRMEENAGMSIERLTKEVTPAVTTVKRDQPQIEAFALENFDESYESFDEPIEVISEVKPEIKPEPTVRPAPPAETAPKNELDRMHVMGQKSMEGLILINILEEVMRLEAPKIMKGLDMCCCDRCLNDVLALALNSIPPRYVVTQRGALFAKISSYGTQYQTDIFSHLTKACVTVSQSPSHP